MQLHAYDMGFSLEGLRHDCDVATRDWDWSQGAYGHTLSLPSRDELHPIGRDNPNNLPYSGMLDRCPTFREIFDRFECDKASFRLLRRTGGTSYGWHTDRDKGPSVVRLQVPIVTNEGSVLVVTDYDSMDEIVGGKKRIHDEEYFNNFKTLNQGRYAQFQFEPGTLYYFNTNKVHDLLNKGGSERTTLSIDLVVNDWVRKQFPAVADELG